MCEPVAALGATVIRADPAKGAIEAASLHALRSDIEIDYRCTTAEDWRMAEKNSTSSSRWKSSSILPTLMCFS